jgi:tocopherol cyclase
MQSPLAFIRGVAHPEAFHGTGKTGGFFEGWYVKLVSADLSQRWAVIPGIFRGLESTEDMAFIQVLDGLSGRSWFHKFEISEFEAATDHFEVRVGENRFCATGVHLALEQLTGDLIYNSSLDPWPVTLKEPGIMGWYGMVPAMECFHAVVSFGHSITGNLSVEGRPVSFEGGRGYIEKDWGKAFPAGYVWMASNHVEGAPEASLVASVAIIPWLHSSFRGFIIGFKHDGKLNKWSTYNRAKETSLLIDDSHVLWHLQGPDGRLELKAERVRGGLLHAPLRTAMYQRVEETLDATIEIKHLDKHGVLLYEGKATCAGLEVFGDIERLLES